MVRTGCDADAAQRVALIVAEPAAHVGLTKIEAAARLQQVGYNELAAIAHRSIFSIAAEVLREPMFGLLLASAAIYGLIGDLGEALILGMFAAASVSIALVQRGRTERVLERLRDLASPRALVVRDGERLRIAGREVVPGDLVIVTEGDRVPADGVLLEGVDIQIDESLLTGESVPVRKRAADLPEAAITSPPGGDDLPFLFSGTLVQRGTGVARVVSTGAATEFGKIGGSVRTIETEPPQLQQQTKRIVLICASGGLVFSVLVILLYGFTRGDWVQGLLGGIALGMALLPEEFPLVLTVFMVMGAWRLSRSRVLTRRATSIETLGAATVLCTDKTGTLTRNTMSVAALRAANADSSTGDLVRIAALACEPQALDPMERAITQFAAEGSGGGTQHLQLVKTYPLRPGLLAFTQVWSEVDTNECVIAAKGAPEAIMGLCHMNAPERKKVADSVDELARQGMRILGVARGRCAREALPESASAMSLEFVGLVALADPLRESVPEAVRECRAAGIRVVMITGDYPETARAIARAAGIPDTNLLTGTELDALGSAELATVVRETTVFARIRPNQKLLIVEALKANGEVVAMTGDGVNDAPALKAAHIGIAMGGRGSDVAREAASIVLLDDDFTSIVRAIRHGRRIYDNLRKAFGYIFAIHIPTAGLALLPIVLGEPLLLTPMLIAFLELIIDPACSIVLEAEHSEADIMRRPPRPARQPLLSRALAIWSVLQGALAFLGVGAVYLIALRAQMPPDEARALAFVALIGANLALILTSRTFGSSMLATLTRPNPSLVWGFSLVAVALAIVLGWPRARGFFGLGPLHLDDLLVCLGLALGLLWLLSVVKRVCRIRVAV